MKTGHLAALLAVLVAAPACNMLATAEGGYVRPRRDPAGQQGAAVNVRLTGFDTNRSRTFGFGGSVGLRGKFAGEMQQVALSEDVMLMAGDSTNLFTPFFRGGFHFLQFERLGGDFGFGMFSPYAEAGVMVRVRQDPIHLSQTYVILGGAAEYDLRFTDQPNRAYYTGFVGVGIGGQFCPPGGGVCTNARRQVLPH